MILVKERNDFVLYACIHNSIVAPLALNRLSEEGSLKVDARVLATTLQIRHLRNSDYFMIISYCSNYHAMSAKYAKTGL